MVTQIFLRASVDSQDLASKEEQIGKQARVVAEKSRTQPDGHAVELTLVSQVWHLPT